jgi:hypothetical protein
MVVVNNVRCARESPPDEPSGVSIDQAELAAVRAFG